MSNHRSLALAALLVHAPFTAFHAQTEGTAAVEPAPPPLTLEATLRPGVHLSPEWPERWSWSEDHTLLVRERDEVRTYFEPRSGKEVPAPAPAKEGAPTDDADEGSERDGLRALFAALDGVDAELAKALARGRAHEASGTTLFEADGRLARLRDGAVALLGERSATPLEFPTLSPDGARVAYVAGNDLFVLDATEGELLTRTTDGGPSQFNGKLDWVYQEEVYGRGDFLAFWWSPDSRHVAFLSLDESPVHTFTVVDHVEDGHFRVKPEVSHYPKAGDPNPVVRLGVLEPATGNRRWIDLADYVELEPLVVRVGWTPDAKLMYVVQDRLQTMADVRVWDPLTGQSTTWIQERSRSWVNRPAEPRWLADGSFLWESDRTGYRHLYRYAGDGRFLRAVTAGDWQVTSVEEVDEERGRVRFGATKDGADERHTYRVDLDGSNLVHLTPGRGTHRLAFAADGTLALDTFSALENPGTAQLVDVETGAVVRVLAEATAEGWDGYGLPRWRAVEVPTRDGLKLDGALLPPKLAPGTAKAPLWIATYSGPDAPSVRDQWNSSPWYAFLASRGIGVLQLNVRTASGLGHWAIEQCYLRLGVQELADFEDALDWLAAEATWFDPERVGISGYSYGGFMTAFALTHSDRFRLGVAGGGVYDWGLYDTIYTERYMSTPQRNPEGYAASSVLKAAKDLRGHLLIAHGVMDDNVHVQNAMQLVYALQKAGMDFDLMLYPQSRHGVRDADQRKFDRRWTWAAIEEHLLGVDG